MKNGNREPLWAHGGEVASGWATEKTKPSGLDKTNAFFYKKLQYHGSVDYAKRHKKQPLPASRDILRQKGVNREHGTDVSRERA